MLFYVALSCLLATAAAQISENCLNCICQAEGCEVGHCYGDVCGPFRITEAYWIDCGRLGRDYVSCTTQMECSRACVRNYMRRYGKYCTGGRPPTCEDYARIHSGGPTGCRNPSTIPFWDQVEPCCASTAGGCGYDFDMLKYKAADIVDDNVY